MRALALLALTACLPPEEVCNGFDDDGDGLVDEDAVDAEILYVDADGDGFGRLRSASRRMCPTEGLVPDATDCDDFDPAVHPGAPERCNGVDDDCDPTTQDDADVDRDGVRVCEGDCDDGDPDTFPDAPERCDGLDNDCDGVVEDERDEDRDGVRVCEGDCDDSDADVFPGAPETCDRRDEDCDGRIDFDGWVPDDWPDPQAAADAAPDGATICLDAGTWVGTFRIDRGVHLRGVDPGLVRLSGTGTAAPTVTVVDGATVSGVRITQRPVLPPAPLLDVSGGGILTDVNLDGPRCPNDSLACGAHLGTVRDGGVLARARLQGLRLRDGDPDATLTPLSIRRGGTVQDLRIEDTSLFITPDGEAPAFVRLVTGEPGSDLDGLVIDGVDLLLERERASAALVQGDEIHDITVRDVIVYRTGERSSVNLVFGTDVRDVTVEGLEARQPLYSLGAVRGTHLAGVALRDVEASATFSTLLSAETAEDLTMDGVRVQAVGEVTRVEGVRLGGWQTDCRLDGLTVRDTTLDTVLTDLSYVGTCDLFDVDLDGVDARQWLRVRSDDRYATSPGLLRLRDLTVSDSRASDVAIDADRVILDRGDLRALEVEDSLFRAGLGDLTLRQVVLAGARIDGPALVGEAVEVSYATLTALDLPGGLIAGTEAPILAHTTISRSEAPTWTTPAAESRWSHTYLAPGDWLRTTFRVTGDPLFRDVTGDDPSAWDLRLDRYSPLVDVGPDGCRDADESPCDVGAWGGPEPLD